MVLEAFLRLVTRIYRQKHIYYGNQILVQRAREYLVAQKSTGYVML